MNILLISSFLPYPLFTGGHIRLFNLIKLLSKKHSITLVCEKRESQKQNDVRELEKYCKIVRVIPRRKQWSMGNILKTGFSISPFLVTGHTSRLMKEEIKSLISQTQFDLIHIETSYVMQNLRSGKLGIPIVLVEHNIEYLVYKRFVDNMPLYLRPILYLDILKLKYWEERMWRKATKLIAVSESEKKIMSLEKKDVVVVPNGVDVNKYQISSIRQAQDKNRKEEKRVLFIGDFRWIQNRDALTQIILDIWPKLRAEVIPSLTEGLKLWVVGRKIPDSIKKLTRDKSIFFDENAPADTQLIYKNAYLLLAPINVGGGTSFKILEAMASGVPVITTRLGNAIGAQDNLEILVAHSPKDFVQRIIELFENKALYSKISTNARKLVEEKFNWDKIANDLNSVYESVVYA
ncbi:MAG: glycosyltransferase family 4 protein [Candidatus Levybacteria bacterium]|nr:glycosyltransferase family 4 protein [Candidatus Levybacteria bacterium]